MRLDIEYIKNLITESKGIISLSDLSFYLKTTNRVIKDNIPILENYFDVNRNGCRIYFSIRAAEYIG